MANVTYTRSFQHQDWIDNEDIVQAGENEIIRNRYKILRIGVNSATVEDTVAKNQQTLQMVDEAQ